MLYLRTVSHNSCVPCTVIWTWRFVAVSLLCVCLHCTVSSAYTSVHNLANALVSLALQQPSSLTVGALAPYKRCVSNHVSFAPASTETRDCVFFFFNICLYTCMNIPTPSCLSKFSHAPDFVQTWEQIIALLRGISHLSSVRVHDVTAGPIFSFLPRVPRVSDLIHHLLSLFLISMSPSPMQPAFNL